jgi:competence ComEA-like helix-hairpin-helix protein
MRVRCHCKVMRRREAIDFACDRLACKLLHESKPLEVLSCFIQTERSNMSKNSVDLNTVDQVALERIQGVGPTLAAKVIDYRDENGPFKTWDDVKKIPGMSTAMIDTLQRQGVTIERKAA